MMSSDAMFLNDIIITEDGPPTRDLDTATALHQIAATNYAYITPKLRSLPNPPDLGSIYRGIATASCAPEHLDLHFIFTHFNAMAHVGFVAHPSLPPEINYAIFTFGLDKGHSLDKNLDQSRYNLSLGVSSGQAS